jgi:hypothetical protein
MGAVSQFLTRATAAPSAATAAMARWESVDAYALRIARRKAAVAPALNLDARIVGTTETGIVVDGSLKSMDAQGSPYGRRAIPEISV